MIAFVVSQSVNAQDVIFQKNITFKINSCTVGFFLDSLSQYLSVGLSVDAQAITADSIVSVSWEQVNLKQGLYQLLGEERVEVSSLPGFIVIGKNSVTRVPELTNTIRIAGKVSDMENGQPLPAVNIGVEDGALGTISNGDGNFEFFLPVQNMGKNIVFSMVGYARQRLVVNTIDTVVDVLMSATQIRLPEIKVKPVAADVIMAKVVELRDRNYLQSTVALTGFFRESIKQNNRFVQVSEALVEIYKPPYSERFNFERVRFIKGRRNENVEQMNLVQFRLQGGPYYFARLDIVRYLDFLPDTKSAPVYKYTYLGAEWANGKTHMKIGFAPFDDTGELLYNGEFLIDPDSYAITSVWFEMTKQTLKESRKYLIRKDSKHYKANPYSARYIVDYRPYGKQWILNSVRGELKVKVVDRKNKLNTDFVAVTEMLISDLRPIDGEKIKYAESFKADYVLADKLSDYDAGFWGNYNVIKPEDALEMVFKRE